MVDEHGDPWTAAARLADDPAFTGLQHGVGDGGESLCGIPPRELVDLPDPFRGNRDRDCAACATRLHSLPLPGAGD